MPIRKSVTPDYMVCLEDGERFRSLKRHLRRAHGMAPEQYRAKWRLAHDYPTVAPNYAKACSELAKEMGFGQQRKKGETTREGGASEPRAGAKTAARPAKVTLASLRRERKAR